MRSQLMFHIDQISAICFATNTNNLYHHCVRRGQPETCEELQADDAMFSTRIHKCEDIHTTGRPMNLNGNNGQGAD